MSSCGSDTGDVLIRSTGVLLPDWRPGSVQITVRKLRDVPSPVSQERKRRGSPRHKAELGASQRAAAASETGDEVLTSRFVAGGRGVVLKALKQRSHSAPPRREVRVQLLDPRPLQTTPDTRSVSSQDAMGEAGAPMKTEVSSSAAAAAAAAAVAAAAAPLIKAQADMEAQVSQLADGVQKLLQADSEGRARGRSLSQQTLQQLETLQSQQLQLQSQLLESALRIVTGHTSSTARPDHLQVTHLDTAAERLSDQPPSSMPSTAPPPAAAADADADPVAMETRCRDRWLDQSRDGRRLRGAPRVSRAERQLQSSANHTWEAARRASEVLREMERMKTLLMEPDDPLKITRPASDQQNHCQPQQNQSQSQQNQTQQIWSQAHQPNAQENHFCSQLSQSQQNLSQENHLEFQKEQCHSQQNQSHSKLFQFQPNHSHQNYFHQTTSQENHFRSQLSQLQHEKHLQLKQNHQTISHQTESQQNQAHQTPSQSQLSHSHQASSQENNGRPQPSQFQLNQPQQNQSLQSQSVQVQKRPVVPSMLEEAGHVLRQVQRRKKILEENLEALLRAKAGEVLDYQLEALAVNRDNSEEVRIKKTVDAWISKLTRDIQAEMSSEDAGVHCTTVADAAVTSQQKAAESTTKTRKGRPVGTPRGTGSRTAVRTGSRGQRAGHRALPADRTTGRAVDGEQVEVDGESYLTRLYGRAPYEGLRRTLKKGPYLRLSSPASPLSRKPRPRLVESVRGVKLKSCKTQTSLAPPLTQVPPLSLAHPPSLVLPLASSSPGQQGIFSSSHPTSGDPDHLTKTPADSHTVTMAIPLGRPRIDCSTRRERPQEVTSPPGAPPTASVEPQVSCSCSGEQHLDVAPPPPLRSVYIIERKSDEETQEEEENIFPGADFLCVDDVVQQEVSVVGEEAMELDGGPSPPPVLYQGPVFPPQAPSALPAQDQVPVPGIDLQRESLENRLVEWVEQQLMSRMISQMYQPPPSDPAQNHHSIQSDPEERSVTSDIVEAAGEAGLQLFVDSSVAVDSKLIRQLVNEVLTETVTLMLGQRDPVDTGPEPGLEPAAHEENKLASLVPTPVPTPPPCPAPPIRETTAITTPPPSKPTSPLNEELSQPITAPEPVATPTPSPEHTCSAGSLPADHQAPPPFPWEDAELPLDEERPEEHVDTYKPSVFMSVEEEEPLLSSPLLPASPPPPSLPPARSPSPPPDPGPASPSTSSDDSSSSSSSSSSTVTAETEAALKHISEGELLISTNQLAATTEGEVVCSFNSSLQDMQDMDFDPPSEGQVRGRDLLRALLTKLEQGVTQRGERPQPEGSWGREDEEVSAGEVRDNWSLKPCAQPGQTSSPGQLSQAADVSEVSFEATNQGSVTVGDLMGTLTSDLHTELSLSPAAHLENTHTPGQVFSDRKLDTHTGEQEEEGTGRMDVHLPPVRPEEEESVSADSESSTSDVF